MKKVAFILSFVFVAVLGMNAYASAEVVKNTTSISIVDLDDDKKPCPANCQEECCTAKKGDVKSADLKNAEMKSANTSTANKKEASCASKCSSSCTGKKTSSAKTTETKKTTKK